MLPMSGISSSAGMKTVDAEPAFELLLVLLCEGMVPMDGAGDDVLDGTIEARLSASLSTHVRGLSKPGASTYQIAATHRTRSLGLPAPRRSTPSS